MAGKVNPVRRRRIRRAILIVVAVLILGPIAAIAIGLGRFDPNAYKPQIAAALERASGRGVALNGPLSLGLSLQPTIAAEDVTLANPPGFSRPEMASLGRLDAKVALLPLLGGRLEIRRLVLVRPEIALEINRDGVSNLAFVQPPKAAAPGTAAPARGGSEREVAVEVRAVRIEDGRLSWQDDRNGAHGVLVLHSFAATAASAGAPLKVAGDAVYAGLPLQLTGETGPLARLAPAAAPSAQGPPPPAWPVQLALTVGTAKASLEGSLADPAALRGGRFHLAAQVPDLEQLAPLVPGWNLPALHGVTVSAELADSGQRWPAVSDLLIAAGASDLGRLRPGLKLATLSLTAPKLDQPCKLALSGTVDAAPFSLMATLGPPAALLPAGFGPAAPAAPWPVAIQVKAADADFSLSGTIGVPATLAGAELAVSAQIPDLVLLSPFAGQLLPRLSQIAFSGQLADAASGWRQWMRLSTFSLSLPQGDVAGEATVALAGARPDVSAAVTSKRLDLDALAAVWAVPGGGAKAVPPAAAPASPAHAGAAYVGTIPDTKLPFAVLNTFNADVTLAISTLAFHGVSYTDLAGKLALKDGKLTVNPFGVQAPAGHVALTASADANAPAPPVGMTVQAPALALSPLLASFGLPAAANGTLEVRAVLRGAGESPHEIASGINGEVGVAMEGGSVDNRLIGELLGSVLRSARIPPEVTGGGTSQVKCLAVRVDATSGIGTVKALALDMTRLTLTGGGSMAFGPETLSLELTPTVTLGTSPISVPVHVSGTFRTPKLAAESAGAISSAARAAGSRVAPQSALGRFLGTLEGRAPPPAAAPAGPNCGEALAVARLGESGPAYPATTTTTPPPSSKPAPAAPKPKGPLDLLRGLFHQ